MNAPDLNNRPWQKSRDFISSAYYFSGDQEGLFWMLDKLEEIVIDHADEIGAWPTERADIRDCFASIKTILRDAATTEKRDTLDDQADRVMRAES
jgi:hypothetical protein